jgi:hypothetical protein
MFCWSQRLFHQDVFHGGVTVGGMSFGQSAGDGQFEVYIEPGSTIRKAYLFSYWIGPRLDSHFITLNDVVYNFNDFDMITEVQHEQESATPIQIYGKEITELISQFDFVYDVSIEWVDTFPILESGQWTATLYIEYDNPSLSKIATTVHINDQYLHGFEHYNFNFPMKIDTTESVGLSIFMDRACDAEVDASFVKILDGPNYIDIGKVWGNSPETEWAACGGSQGHFYYQNSELFGLSDDTPDYFMDSSDALCDIRPYLIDLNTDSEYSLRLIHNRFGENVPATWNVNQYFFHTYTTPCDTFSISLTQDTVLCKGDSIHLQASGNTNYAWLYGDHISDTSVANPWVKPDSSQLYTILINDGNGCGKVANVIVKVNETPKIENLEITETLCGEANGIVEITEISNEEVGYFISQDFVSQQTETIFSSLNGQEYTFSITNPTGCHFDTVVSIPVSQNVVADFYASPESGYAPLDIQLTNTSENANTYVWDLGNGISSNDEHPFTTYDTSGTYQVALISYYNETACADTAYLTILVFESIKAIVPNVFSPNTDQINDLFTIDIEGAFQITGTIKNRWGNTMNAFDKTLDGTLQTIDLWNGANANPGVYFYKFILEDITGKEQVFQGHLTLRLN